MSKLTTCSRCDSFLPHMAVECPHCGATRGPKPLPKPLVGLMALGAGGLLAMTLSACYGGGVGMPAEPFCSDPSTDIDNDMHCGIYDCNESDPNVNDNAPDPLGDGIDTNCDGVDGVLGDAGM